MQISGLKRRLALLFLIAIPSGISLWKKVRHDPLEHALESYVGMDAVDCGSFEENEKPLPKVIAGCVANARSSGRSFRVRRNLIYQESHYSTAIAGLPDGTTRTFFIERKKWSSFLISNKYVPDGGYRWTLDLNDVRGHQAELQF